MTARRSRPGRGWSAGTTTRPWQSLNNLAILYHAQGRVDEALALDREILGHRRRRLGADHPQTIGSLNNVAYRLGTLGRYERSTTVAGGGAGRSASGRGACRPPQLRERCCTASGRLSWAQATSRRPTSACWRHWPSTGNSPGIGFWAWCSTSWRRSTHARGIHRRRSIACPSAVQAGAFRGGADELARNVHLAALAGTPRFQAAARPGARQRASPESATAGSRPGYSPGFLLYFSIISLNISAGVFFALIISWIISVEGGTILLARR